MRLYRGKRIGDDQRISAVVLDRSGKRVGIGIGGHGDGHFMRSGVVRHAGNMVIDLGDGVFVNADIGIFNVGKHSYRSVLVDGQAGHGGHGSAVGDGGQYESEEAGFAPVVELLGGFEVSLYGSEGVGDNKRVGALVIHCRHELVGVRGLGNGNCHLVRRSVVRDACHAVVDLSDGIFVHTNGVKLKLREDGGGFAFGNRKAGHGRHRSAVGNGSQHEGERIRLAPVVELLGGLEVSLYGSERVGDDQCIRPVVFNFSGKRVGIGIGSHGDCYLVRSGVISNAGNTVIDFCDRVLIHANCRIFEF